MAVNALSRIDDNAKSFTDSLLKLAVAMDGEIENVIRLGIFKMFASIIKRSPVDTGAYRASHGISNSDPDEKESIRQGEYPAGGGNQGLAGAAWAEKEGWRWTIQDGTIYLYNNQPYALRLEEGHSTQAGQGIYAMALAEFDQILQEELRGVDGLEPTG